MKIFFLFFYLFSGIFLHAQKTKALPTKKELFQNVSKDACKCTDSIKIVHKEKFEINEEISQCIDKQVLIYQLGAKMAMVAENPTEAKNVNIEVNSNKESEDYKKYFYEIQNYLLDHCESVKSAISTVEREAEAYVPKNKAAITAYNDGLAENRKENWENARKKFEKAVKEDPGFAYAWDNLGLTYRRLKLYDKSIEAYQKSLAINPSGKMPLQNLPIAYSYSKEFQKAIAAFENFEKYYPGDPEVYYGIGQIYYQHLQEYEKSLGYMCKAFNAYTTLKSPYRADAETIIVYIYRKMKEQNKLDKFNEILIENKIEPIKP